jgi:hypothetical protein
MIRRLAATLALAAALTACTAPRAAPRDEVRFQICPPVCPHGHHQPAPTTTWWTYDPTPPPNACIGHAGDDDAHIVFPPQCDPEG